jgi:Tfp pilus assembly protein FimT
MKRVMLTFFELIIAMGILGALAKLAIPDFLALCQDAKNISHHTVSTKK